MTGKLKSSGRQRNPLDNNFQCRYTIRTSSLRLKGPEQENVNSNPKPIPEYIHAVIQWTGIV